MPERVCDSLEREVCESVCEAFEREVCVRGLVAKQSYQPYIILHRFTGVKSFTCIHADTDIYKHIHTYIKAEEDDDDHAAPASARPPSPKPQVDAG